MSSTIAVRTRNRSSSSPSPPRTRSMARSVSRSSADPAKRVRCQTDGAARQGSTQLHTSRNQPTPSLRCPNMRLTALPATPPTPRPVARRWGRGCLAHRQGETQPGVKGARLRSAGRKDAVRRAVGHPSRPNARARTALPAWAASRFGAEPSPPAQTTKPSAHTAEYCPSWAALPEAPPRPTPRHLPLHAKWPRPHPERAVGKPVPQGSFHQRRCSSMPLPRAHTPAEYCPATPPGRATRADTKRALVHIRPPGQQHALGPTGAPHASAADQDHLLHGRRARGTPGTRPPLCPTESEHAQPAPRLAPRLVATPRPARQVLGLAPGVG